MTFAIHAEAPPLREDADGAVRIGNSRVLLDLFIQAFQDGATPESIVERYSTLTLSDVYAVIAYYLRHAKEIDQYIERREQEGNAVQQRIESQQPDLNKIRERLRARRKA